MAAVGELVSQALERILELLGLDPFAYLVVTIVGIIVWTWCSVIGDFAITGRGLWIRRVSLVAAVLGAALFAEGARSLR
jgi:hypothetical protein